MGWQGIGRSRTAEGKPQCRATLEAGAAPPRGSAAEVSIPRSRNVRECAFHRHPGRHLGHGGDEHPVSHGTRDERGPRSMVRHTAELHVSMSRVLCLESTARRHATRRAHCYSTARPRPQRCRLMIQTARRYDLVLCCRSGRGRGDTRGSLNGARTTGQGIPATGQVDRPSTEGADKNVPFFLAMHSCLQGWTEGSYLKAQRRGVPACEPTCCCLGQRVVLGA